MPLPDIRNGQVFTNERITPCILHDERLSPENDVLAERMRERRFSRLGPRLWQALLTFEELAVSIDQRDERDGNAKHAADKLRQSVEGLVCGRVEETGRAQGPQAFRRRDVGKDFFSRPWLGSTCVHERPSERQRSRRVCAVQHRP